MGGISHWRAPNWLDQFLRSTARKTWGTKNRRAFYRRVAAQTRKGLRLAESVRILERRARARWSAWTYDPEVLAMSEIAARIENGLSFERALAGWAPPAELSIIAAGSRAGKLPDALLLAIGMGQTTKRIRNRIFAELWEPGLFAAVGVYLVYVIGTQMLPAMEGVVPVNRWPLSAKFLLPLAWLVTSGAGSVISVGFLVLVATIYFTLPHWSRHGRRYFDRIPPWSVYRVLQGAAWISGFASLLSAGERIEAALAVQAEQATHWLKDRLLAARVEVQNGEEIGTALAHTGFGFPDPLLIDDISVYSGAADFPALIRELTDEWIAEKEEQILAVIKVLGAMFNIGVNIIILLMVVGMNSLQNMITTGPH
ncbi:MAG: type II secretion system F family protein [Acidiferrobacterales bacterium]